MCGYWVGTAEINVIPGTHLREWIRIKLLKRSLFSVPQAYPDKLCRFPIDKNNAILNLWADERLKIIFNDQIPSGALASDFWMHVLYASFSPCCSSVEMWANFKKVCSSTEAIVVGFLELFKEQKAGLFLQYWEHTEENPLPRTYISSLLNEFSHIAENITTLRETRALKILGWINYETKYKKYLLAHRHP